MLYCFNYLSYRHFDFVLAFPSTAVIPQSAGLSLVQFAKKVFVHGCNVEQALEETCLVDSQLMHTLAIHLTLRRTNNTVKQVVFAHTATSNIWGPIMRCPNPRCTGTPVDVHPRLHNRQGPNLVRFRCVACKQQTKDYLARPSWTREYGKVKQISVYALYVNGRPADEAIIGAPIKEWLPQDSVADAMDTK